jgi:hypothetical protein
MSWINEGELKRIVHPEWQLTIEDLCDLMANYKTARAVGDQQEFAARAISFVMGNLERRGLIEDQFMDIRDNTLKEEV